MRLFIGIFLPEEIRKQVEEIQRKLEKSGLFNGKYAELENLHLTLKFLGEVDEGKLEEIKEALKQIKSKSFNSSLEGAGLFTPSRPRIVWLHLAGAEELQKQIDAVMEKEGFKKEERFMSHITIARVKHITPIASKKLMEELKKIKLGKEFKVNKFSLIKSVLTEKGPEYEVIEEFELS
ncbi:RNA 2',3'-cyclic phosphodiesterase [Candidatus Pacearchaeota archaeon]|nr:RNA 2',3'-cyclic phosphodiesterase [Candidatus Pacearchaeota archaeon]